MTNSTCSAHPYQGTFRASTRHLVIDLQPHVPEVPKACIRCAVNPDPKAIRQGIALSDVMNRWFAHRGVHSPNMGDRNGCVPMLFVMGEIQYPCGLHAYFHMSEGWWNANCVVGVVGGCFYIPRCGSEMNRSDRLARVSGRDLQILVLTAGRQQRDMRLAGSSCVPRSEAL